MPKASRSPVLYEVLGRGTSADIPDSSGSSGSCASGTSVRLDHTAGSASAGSSTGSPMLELAGDRIRVTVSTFGAAIAVGLAVASLLVAYGIGKDLGYERGRADGARAYQADVESDIQAAKSGPVSAGLLRGLRPRVEVAEVRPEGEAVRESSQAAVAHPSADKANWTRGHTYIVVQEFRPGSGEDVYVAQEFMAENGISTSVVHRESGGFWLVTSDGYDRSNSAGKRMAKRLLQRVREVGAAFKAAGGRYGLEGYYRKLTSETW